MIALIPSQFPNLLILSQSQRWMSARFVAFLPRARILPWQQHTCVAFSAWSPIFPEHVKIPETVALSSDQQTDSTSPSLSLSSGVSVPPPYQLPKVKSNFVVRLRGIILPKLHLIRDRYRHPIIRSLCDHAMLSHMK